MILARLLLAAALGAALVPAALAGEADVPLPHHRPDVPAAEPERPVNPAPVVGPDTGGQDEAGQGIDPALARAGCEASLKAAGVDFTWIGTAQKETCTLDTAVELDSVDAGSGPVTFPEKPVLGCDFAARLGLWTRDIAAPVIAGVAGDPLSEIASGPGFVCRYRNGGSSTKVSEHAKGNAIDITAFKLADGHSLQVGSVHGAGAKRAVQALRTAACGYFTTVLGPGANDAHRSHFHFDYGQHGKTLNYRICE